MKYQHQKQIRAESELIIIGLLFNNSLTFSEVIEKSKLSRGVVNSVLKCFVKRGWITKYYDNKDKALKNKLLINPTKKNYILHLLERLKELKEVREKMFYQLQQLLNSKHYIAKV